MNSSTVGDCFEIPPPARGRYPENWLSSSEPGMVPSRIVHVGLESQEGAPDESRNTSCDWRIVRNPDRSRYLIFGIRRTSNVADTELWAYDTTADVSFATERGSSEAGTWVLSIEQELAENVKDARDTDGVVVDESAIRACLSLARALAPFLIPSASLKSGAFAEDDGCVALVVQLLATGRRLTCRVSADGNTVRVIRIDENMKSEVSHMSLGDKGTPRELARWVLARA